MSSAANHRARSCRSYARHKSAIRGAQKYIAAQQRRNAGADGSPLIFRLQAFKRWRESRKATAEKGAEA